MRTLKKLITIFFLLLISIQFLPIKEIGQCISDSAFIEEEVIKNIASEYLPTAPVIDLEYGEQNVLSYNTIVKTYFVADVEIHKPPIKEVLAPPPNI